MSVFWGLRITLSVHVLIIATIVIGRAGNATTPEEQALFQKSVSNEKVVVSAFAGGFYSFAGFLLDMGEYGEWRLLKLEKEKVVEVKSGRIKKDSIPLTGLSFVGDGSHALITVGERRQNRIFVDISIYSLGVNPGEKIFRLTKVLEPRIEQLSEYTLLLWQKDQSYYNLVSLPYKYNYYLITFDPTTGTYSFGFHLRKIPFNPEDEGVILNNRAVQLFLQGELKSAQQKLEEANMVANIFRNIINENMRYISAEIEAIKQSQKGTYSYNPSLENGPDNSNSPSVNQPLPSYDNSKLYYILGDYDTALMQLGGDRGKYQPDSLALLGLIYARKKEYANMQRVTRVLLEKRYPAMKEYYEELSKILFYNRDMEVLKAHLKVLEKADPLSPTLNYLKAAVLVDGKRLAFAKELLEKYINRADDGTRDLSIVKEYLYEIAKVMGDNTLAQKMFREVIDGDKVDLRYTAYVATFDGIIHTEIIQVPANVGTRFEGPFEKIEIIPPEIPETPQTPPQIK